MCVIQGADSCDAVQVCILQTYSTQNTQTHLDNLDNTLREGSHSQTPHSLWLQNREVPKWKWTI